LGVDLATALSEQSIGPSRKRRRRHADTVRLLGLSICYDVRFPALYQQLVDKARWR
jgi:predicted amidohydrolase